MDSRTTNLHGDNRIQYAHGCFEGLQVRVLVREDAKKAIVDAQTAASMDILL